MEDPFLEKISDLSQGKKLLLQIYKCRIAFLRWNGLAQNPEASRTLPRHTQKITAFELS